MEKSEFQEISVRFMEIIERFVKVSGYGPEHLGLFNGVESSDRDEKDLLLKIELLERSLVLLR